MPRVLSILESGGDEVDAAMLHSRRTHVRRIMDRSTNVFENIIEAAFQCDDDMDILNVLLDRVPGIDVRQNVSVQACVHSARAMARFIEAGGDVWPDGRTMKHLCVRGDHADVAAMIMPPAGDDLPSRCIIEYAVRRRRIRVARVLLQDPRVDVNAVIPCVSNLFSLVETAVRLHDVAMTRLLLDRGAVLKKEDARELVMFAQRPGYRSMDTTTMCEMLTLLLSQPGVNAEGTTVISDRPDAIQIMYDHGADLDDYYDPGSRPLLNAVKRGDFACVEYLLRAPRRQRGVTDGVDVNFFCCGECPLKAALSTNSMRMIDLLFAMRTPEMARPRNTGALDVTRALHWVHLDAYGNRSIVERLLGMPGVDVNAREENGDTFLHRVSRRCDRVLLPMTLSTKRIDVNAVNVAGQTPLDVCGALRTQDCPDHRDGLLLLKKAGALRGKKEKQSFCVVS